MNKITFELDDTYYSKLVELSKNSSVEDKSKEIVTNYINSHSTGNFSKPKPLDRRSLGI